MTAGTRIAELNDGLADDYRLGTRLIVPSEPFIADGLVLKWYDQAAPDNPICPERQRAARQFLASQIASFELEHDGQMGFVFLHDCRSVVFLFAGVWRNNNELWGRVFIQSEGETGFDPLVPVDGPNPLFCVWEMAIVWHESQARTRYLLSTRTADDRIAWLQDLVEGVTPAA